MRLLWHENGWDDYVWWQSQDKKTLKRINLLIRDMQRSPFEGNLSAYFRKFLVFFHLILRV